MSVDQVKPDIDQGLGLSTGAEVLIDNLERESNSVDRLEKTRKRKGILTYERLTEFLLTNTYFGLESYYDIHKVPENYTWLLGTTRENTPIPNLTPEIKQMFDSMGDVLEISVGSGIVRFSLAVVEEIVKTEPIKKIVRNAMSHDGMKKVLTKVIGPEKTDELAISGEIKMSDDSQFWAALVPWTIVKAAHSLGMISLGANDHIGAPVPHMLIGQAFAVATLAGVHYGTKHSDEIVKMASKVFEDAKKNSQTTLEGLETYAYMAMYGIEDILSDGTKVIEMMSQTMAKWDNKMDNFDPEKIIPSADLVWRKILGERVWAALGRNAVEHIVEVSEPGGTGEESVQ